MSISQLRPIQNKSWLWLVLLTYLATAVSCGNRRLPWERKPIEDSIDEEESPTSTPITTTDNSQTTSPVLSSSLENLEALQTSINLQPWLLSGGGCATSKIAIIDNGFAGLDSSIGKRLPPLEVEKFSGNPQMNTAHGTKLAELIWALCTGQVAYSTESAKLGPIIKLFNGNGLTNFTNAVNAIETGAFDFVLYSQVWEYGGNFDGMGFINAIVNRVAKETNTIWLNSAGNYGMSSWEGPISFETQTQRNSPSIALLPLQNNRVKMIVESESTPVKITASWNDFKDDKSFRTNQDLDMKVLNYYGELVAESKLIQDGLTRTTKPGYSSHAREQVNTVLGAGVYEIELSSNRPAMFSRDSKVRVSANGVGIRFEGVRPTSSVMIPADNLNVFAIGASDFQGSSFDVSINNSFDATNIVTKPEFKLMSKTVFLGEDKSKLEFVGTSSAAAIAAATLMVHASKCGPWSKRALMAVSISLRKQGKDLVLPKDSKQCLSP